MKVINAIIAVLITLNVYPLIVGTKYVAITDIRIALLLALLYFLNRK